jgi:hypothetical protein
MEGNILCVFFKLSESAGIFPLPMGYTQDLFGAFPAQLGLQANSLISFSSGWLFDHFHGGLSLW